MFRLREATALLLERPVLTFTHTEASAYADAALTFINTSTERSECWALLDIPDTYKHTYINTNVHMYIHTYKCTYKRTTYECMYIKPYIDTCINKHGYIQTYATCINALAEHCDCDCQATQPQKLENQIKIRIQQGTLFVSFLVRVSRPTNVL